MNEKNFESYGNRFYICDKKLRVFFDEDCIRFCGKDAAEILGFKSGIDAVNRYCPNKVKHPMLAEQTIQTLYVTAITEGDLENLLDHARADEYVCHCFETTLYADILPAYKKYRQKVLANRSKKEKLNAAKTEANKPVEKAFVDDLEDDYDPDMEWLTEKNPIRRMAKRILSGTPLKDGTPLTDLFEFDKKAIIHLISLSHLDDDVCEPYVEALALK